MRNKRLIHSLFITMFLVFLAARLYGADTWSLFLGTNGHDLANLVETTSDGGYLLLGSLDSPDPQAFKPNLAAIKLDARHQIEWKTTFYAPYDNSIGVTTGVPYGVLETTDGYYISTFNSITKLSRAGAVLWHKSYTNQFLTPIRPTAGGLILGLNIGYGMFSILGLQPDGNVMTRHFFRSSTDLNVVTSVRSLPGGGSVSAGWNSFGSKAFFLMKANSSGSVVWWKEYGNPSYDSYFLDEMIKTSDGGYALIGSTATQNRTAPPLAWFFKVDSDGNLEWKKTFLRKGFSRIHQTNDGGYIVVGARAELWKFDSAGKIEWIRLYNAGRRSLFTDVKPTLDGGYVVSGRAVSGNSKEDLWLLKVDDKGRIKPGCVNVQKQPRPAATSLDVAVSNITSVHTKSGSSKARLIKTFPGDPLTKFSACD